MKEEDFEGSIVLEALAERELLDKFWEAVDKDDFRAAKQLMKAARIDSETIEMVLTKMANPSSGH